MKIVFFNQSVEDFVCSLDKTTLAKLLRTVDLLEKFENLLGMPHSKKVSKGLFELRIRGEKEVRVMYCFYKNQIVLLHAFLKKTQRIPQRHLQLAKNRRNKLEEI